MIDSTDTTLAADGFVRLRRTLPPGLLAAGRDALLRTARRIGASEATLDEAWNGFKACDRSLGGLLYNAAKRLPEVHAVATAPELLSALRAAGMEEPALVDVNFRIDSAGEDAFLFDWHQDYWFSVCSPKALVAWIPFAPVTPQTGGVEFISNRDTGGRIFRTTGGEHYRSYADAVRLDEPAPASAHRYTFDLDVGDLLLFRFDVLHRSLPVRSPEASRWTLQARYADLADPNFRADGYKPGQVSAASTSYFEKRDPDVD